MRRARGYLFFPGVPRRKARPASPGVVLARSFMPSGSAGLGRTRWDREGQRPRLLAERQHPQGGGCEPGGANGPTESCAIPHVNDENPLIPSLVSHVGGKPTASEGPPAKGLPTGCGRTSPHYSRSLPSLRSARWLRPGRGAATEPPRASWPGHVLGQHRVDEDPTRSIPVGSVEKRVLTDPRGRLNDRFERILPGT
jgi:hypothetical protein